MSEKIRITPAKPCCDSCVIEALTIAGFDYHEPFVVYSSLGSMPPRARREFVEQLIASAEAGVALIVSTPIPAELRAAAEQNATESAGQPQDESAAPSPAELSGILGLADQSATGE